MGQCVVCSSEIRDDARFCPSCGAEQPRVQVAGTDADPLMGKVVARKFKVEKLLGVGGMGKVYKARQLSLDKDVVVKVLHDHFREDPQLVQRFQREAKAASRLNHPNSIQIIDFGQDEGGVVFMAMEFLQGQDLFSLIKKDGPLPPDRLAKVMMQVCSALAEAHEQNVIHRDLKPENIMIEDRRGQKDFVKVLDFGIAKIQDPGEGQQALTQAGMVCGTPEYMSPEQARGMQLDPRSDIYALGVVMYQLATGELPFVADTPIGIVTKHILEKPAPPRTRRPSIPEELEQIILKAMEKDANNRFSTVTELGESLERLYIGLQAQGLATPRTNPGEGSGAFPRTGGVTSQPNKLPTQVPTNNNPNNTSSPTKTAPTPHGTMVGTQASSGQADPSTSAPTEATASGLKIAAAAFVVVLVVLVGVIVALKDKILGPSAATDAGVVVAVVATDAGHAPVVHDAGFAAPVIVDAGVAASEPDAGFRVVDAGVKKENPNPNPNNNNNKPPPSGDRAEAMKVYREAHKKFEENDCAGAMPGLIKAGQIDTTFGEPLRDIAMCAKRQKNAKGACSAIKEYLSRKKITGANAELTLKVYCQ